MKVMIGIVLVASLVLTGCVNPQVKRAEEYRHAAWTQVQAGDMELSEYWKLTYNLIQGLKNIDEIKKSSRMKLANYMIDASLAYESGNISQTEFESRERQAMIYLTEMDALKKKQIIESLGLVWNGQGLASQ